MRILDWDTGDHKELREFIRVRLVAGFWSYDELLEWVLEWAADSGVVQSDDARALLQSMWNERLVEQAGWHDTGDYGRLKDAFTQLESEGILARMCFTCCNTCATAEIDNERTPNPDPNDWYRHREWAYVYFHEQDALRLGDPEPLLLLGSSAFRAHPGLPRELLEASYDGDQAAIMEVTDRTDSIVGQQIVAAVNRAGLSTAWSGSRHQRIEVHIPQWRKPLMAESR